jgi:predicted DCC family thiol-disulfide oxidoreductase YuxK
MSGRSVVLYDADCGLCRWATDRIVRWDRKGRLRAVPLQASEADRLLGSMDPARRTTSWHLVSPDGVVRSAGAAVPPLLRLLPGGRPLAAAAERLPRTTDRAYAWIVRHRTELGRMLGQRRCAVDPSRTGAP